MNRPAFFKIFLFALLSGAVSGAGRCFAAQTKDYAVQVSAVVQVSPPKITLSWTQDTAIVSTAYAVSRKLKEETGWNLLATLSGTTLSYADTSVSAGSSYEYKISRTASGYTAAHN